MATVLTTDKLVSRALPSLAMIAIAAFVSVATIYAYPRVAERIESAQLPARQPLAINRQNDCHAAQSFVLDGSATTIERIAGRQTLTQDFAAVEPLGALLDVRTDGVVNLDMHLEAMHRGDGFSEGVGFGTYISYQFAERQDLLAAAPVIQPAGWASGINIRDLRDHYGHNSVVGALPVRRGFYKFCVYSSAHSYLTSRKDIAELIVDKKFGPRNVLRFTFLPGARLLR